MGSPSKKKDAKKEQCLTVGITGMTCASCELLLERKIKAIPGVASVEVNHKADRARIAVKNGCTLDRDALASVIHAAGYSLTDENAATLRSVAPDKRKWLEIGASLLVIFALYTILQTLDLVSLAPSTSGALSLGGIFVIGLVAGTSSCLAVTGGLLLAIAAKHNELHRSASSAEKFKPLLQFNIGRLAAYYVFGGLVGLLGSTITLSTQATGYMNIVVALVMLYLALTILQLIPKNSCPIRPPKRLSHWIAGISESKHPAAPMTLGAMTFFLPCGFTQSLQLAALATGNFVMGATIMFVFALGTLPSLLGISVISSKAPGNGSRLFLRFSGSLVLLLAVFNLQSGFALTGIHTSGAFAGDKGSNAAVAPTIRGNVQEVSMKVTSYGYEPSSLTINAGVPVRWKIDGTGATGCTSIMTIPALNISQPLRSGENIIEFTALEKGQLAFMCSMGMVRGTFNVI
ncbi:sulfite exporter TauE/SafE family protein [Candidatus Peregrinibacteria bacterium]|nr:sulfite exporter TauE/SafE family protein [Candidatus Peregrinibacteria bacterium]